MLKLRRIRRTNIEGRFSLDSLSLTGNNGTEKIPALRLLTNRKDRNNETRKIQHESKRYIEIANVFLVCCLWMWEFSLIYSLEVEVTGCS